MKRRHRVWPFAVALLVACAGEPPRAAPEPELRPEATAPAPEPPPPPAPVAPAEQPPLADPPAPPTTASAEPVAEPARPAEPAGAGCDVDASHCCLRDGTVVRPGGCQPMYPAGVRPATERGPDGFCVQIPCYLRCLPETARIATPGGDVHVSELAAGDVVYSRTPAGERVAVPVVRVVAVPVAGTHAVVELTLDDGRRVRASAGHPLAVDGELGGLRPGDTLDGATVTGARLLPYAGAATWDLRPAGPTGVYWADGVLLGSTLGP